jgi:hypothetical protein
MAVAAMVEAVRVEQKRAELIGRLGVHFARVEPFAQLGSTDECRIGGVPEIEDAL